MSFGFGCGQTEHLAARRDYPRDEERRNRTVSWPGDVSLMGEHRLNPPASCHPHRRPVGRLFPTGRAARRSVFFACRVFSPSAGRGSGPGLPLSFTPTEGQTAKETPPGSSAGGQSTCGNTTSNEATVATPTLGRLCIDPTMNPTAAVAVLRSSYSG